MTTKWANVGGKGRSIGRWVAPCLYLIDTEVEARKNSVKRARLPLGCIAPLLHPGSQAGSSFLVANEKTHNQAAILGI